MAAKVISNSVLNQGLLMFITKVINKCYTLQQFVLDFALSLIKCSIKLRTLTRTFACLICLIRTSTDQICGFTSIWSDWTTATGRLVGPVKIRGKVFSKRQQPPPIRESNQKSTVRRSETGLCHCYVYLKQATFCLKTAMLVFYNP